jgi:LPS-assembly protein
MIFFNMLSKKAPYVGLLLVLSTQALSLDVPKIIKWQRDSLTDTLCEGYYKEPLLINHAHTGTSVKSKRAEGVLNETMHLYGNVNVQRNGALLKADRAHFYRDPKTRELHKIELDGNVSVQKPGQWLSGKHALIWRNIDKGKLDDAWYRFAREDEAKVVGQERRWYGLTSWGHARSIEQLSENQYRMNDASYAACPPDRNIWSLQAKRLDIDRDKNEAYGYNTVLKVRDVPVFYWPYFSYPIDKRRKSGFLMPSYNATRRSGNDLSVPFYFNLAPNYDALITGHHLSLRGFLFEGHGRYLGRDSQSDLNLAFINHDERFASFLNRMEREGTRVNAHGSNRLGGRLFYQKRLSDTWKMNLDYSNVSDDYFYRDLSSNLVSGNQQHLLQKVDFNYAGFSEADSQSESTFRATLQRYKTLHPHDEAAVLDQYGMLPQLDYQYRHTWSPIVFNMHSQATKFKWPNRDIVDRVDGERYVVEPSISYEYKPEYGFFIPTLHNRLAYYSLRNPDNFINANNLTVPDHPELNIPYVTADMGLYFDKTWTSRFTQTLIPRLFYVYIPNKQQETVPLFDTGLNNFSQSYLFNPNRFTGMDRLGDSHHLTYALSTEYKDLLMSRTFMTASIGQIHYFKDREQSFCYGRDCVGRQYLSPRATTSPLIAQYGFSWGDKFSTHMNYAWHHSPRYASADVNYRGKRNHLYSLNYNYAKANLSVDEQGNYTFTKLKNVKFAAAVPLTKSWHVLGSWGYNLTDDHAHTYFAGGEYESCCWAFRVVGGQKLLYLDTAQQAHFDRMIYIQLLIKGLSSFGDNPKALIASVLPGYQDQYSERFTL